MCAEELIKEDRRGLDPADQLMVYLRRIDFMSADSSKLIVSPHHLESGNIYVFKKDFDSYLCSTGRVYVKKDTICQCISESRALFFFGSMNTLPWEAIRMLKSDSGRYLDDITGLYLQMRRKLC